MEGILNAIVPVIGWVERQPTIAILTMLSGFLLWMAFRDKLRPTNGYAMKKDLEAHVRTTSEQFIRVHDELADHRDELNDFRVKVAETNVTKTDLHAAEDRIIKHISAVAGRR